MKPVPFPIEALATEVRLRDSRVAGEHLVWLERRGGKGVLVRWNGVPQDLTAGIDVGSSLGYGGGDFDLAGDLVVFVQDGALWQLALDAGEPTRLTPSFGQAASPAISPDLGRVAYVHRDDDVDRLAIVATDGRSWPVILAQGADFYMQPAWSPDGEHLAWVEWDFPAMPWTSSRLMLATLGHGTPSGVNAVAGGDGVGVFQPLFSADGRSLYYVDNEGETDRLVRLDLASRSREVLLTGAIMEAAFDQGMRCMSLGPGGALYVRSSQEGAATLHRIDPAGTTDAPVSLAGYTWLSRPCGDAQRLVAVAESPTCPPRLVEWRGGDWTTLRFASAERHEPWLSRGRHITFENADGRQVFALHYPPTGEPPIRPKAVILVHGGPTSVRVLSFDPLVQFLATRGYSVLQLNHRGSTGYGRAYREALDGNWGVVDVEDAKAAADWLRANRLASPGGVAIMGGSAGGYTTLMALATQPGAFNAGVSLFGVTDLLGLAQRTHKLERRYLDGLVGPLPEALATYLERSPITHASAIRDPLCLFQGREDKVVLLSDAEAFVAALRHHGVPHRYTAYEGEGHGWSKPDTIRDFYSQLEGFLREKLR